MAWVEGARCRAVSSGAVAQLGERRPCKAEVVGSSPISSTRLRKVERFEGALLRREVSQQAQLRAQQPYRSLTTELG